MLTMLLILAKKIAVNKLAMINHLFALIQAILDYSIGFMPTMTIVVKKLAIVVFVYNVLLTNIW